ncbi:hypothetical protein VB780_12835 [Leptolyngbya sp. CCNP1308]|uniref:hypothetical protein n=1 Tax=Leptolyngbya sp. CCNP1308 TaxID=3110255 RepID=UPI002B1FA2B0|nr:hypothetical protein [Leptolyngbya sp. CCNP1308]MEA5449462.1 hypothetical protein [Leptolyngbya sp. CCNP1308]
MSRRQRVILRLDVEVDSDAGRLFTYLKTNPAISLREAVLRALNVFYLPWALEPDLSPPELQTLAQTLLEDMQLRSLQLQTRFLAISGAPPVLVMAQSPGPQPLSEVPRAAESLSSVQAESDPFIDVDMDLAAAGLDDF